MPNLVPNSLSRPADILLPIWNHGHPAALDIHVISPLQQQTVGKANFTPGHVLQVGIQRKLASHLSACRRLISQLADLHGWISFPSWLRCWVACLRTPFPSSAHLGMPLVGESAPKAPTPAPRNSFIVWPSLCGWGTLAFGCNTS